VSAPNKKTVAEGKNAYRIPEGSAWSGAWKIAAGIGALGIAGAAGGYFTDPGRFAYSYLFAFFLFLTIAFGSMFFVLVERLTGAGWSITVRRTAEFFVSGAPVFIVLFLPLLLCLWTLYPWLGEKAGENALEKPAHAQPMSPTGPNDKSFYSPEKISISGPHHAEDEAIEEGAAHHEDPEEVVEQQTIAKKHAWLNKPSFLVRALIYFLVWGWIATTFVKLSTDQDKTKDPKLTVRAQKLAPAATFLFGFTLTGAAFDWLMSMLPTWYSTIFGVTIFAGSVVSMYATMIVVTMALRDAGHLKNAVNVEHYHDLGKLMFGFLVFWAYVSFAQYMLIWYASIPEEVTFYHHRWDVGPWKTISTIIIFCHFIVPFFLVLSRNAKRKLGVLRFGALWLLAMHVVEVYWFVMPYCGDGNVALSWIDIACFLGVGGVYLAIVFQRMARHPLIPIGDPRLSRSLTFENA